MTDEDGQFELLIPDSLQNRKVSFHSPGYALQSLDIGLFGEAPSTVLLSYSITRLEEVIVTKKGYRTKEVVLAAKDKLGQNASMTLSQEKSGGGAIASLFSAPTNGVWLDKVSIKIKRNLTDSIKVRIRVLAQDDTGKPGSDLYPESIIGVSTMKDGWWTIDLADKGIYINEQHFYVCYELIETLPARLEIAKRRSLKNQKMYALYDKGVKGIEVKTDSSGTRIGWISSLSRKDAALHGVDFPTGNSYFAISPSKGFDTYVRKTSFDQWKPLHNGRFSLVNGINLSYSVDKNPSKKTTARVVNNAYPIIWGQERVGFQTVNAQDDSRLYKAKKYEDGSEVPANTSRPIQLNIWYPTDDAKATTTMLTYIRTLASAEGVASPSEELDQALMTSMSAFGYSEGYSKSESNVQLDAKPKHGSFPLIIYVPGLSGDAIENYKLCEVLASYGYMVVSIPSLGAAAREMEMNASDLLTQSDDITYAIGWAKEHLNVDDEVGIIGYSWGSMSGVVSAIKNDVKLFISLDGSVYSYANILKNATNDFTSQHTKFVFLSRRKLDRSKFILYDEIQADKRFLEIFDMDHEDFISMGVDLNSQQDPLVRDRYGRLVSLVSRLVNYTFKSKENSKPGAPFVREWE